MQHDVIEKPVFTDVMVDIETTGTNYERNAIIQIAAVKFNYETGEVSPDMFDRCLHVPAGRVMDPECYQNFWLRQGDLLDRIQARGEDPYTVMRAFQQWLCADWPSHREEGLQFWGKPTSFDHAFLAHYFSWYSLDFPCHFRYARDLNSFMAGLAGKTGHPARDDDPALAGEAHNAIYDVLHQIQLLFHAKSKTVRAELVA